MQFHKAGPAKGDMLQAEMRTKAAPCTETSLCMKNSSPKTTGNNLIWFYLSNWVHPS